MTNILGPRSSGDILSEIFEFLRKNFSRILAIVAIVEVVHMALLILLQTVESLIPLILIGIVFLMYTIVAIPLMEGALIQAVSEQYVGQTIVIVRAYYYALRSLEALVGAMVLAGVAIVGGTLAVFGIALIIASILGRISAILPLVLLGGVVYFIVRWSFIFQAVLLDGLGPRDALSRSSALVKRNWRRVLGIMSVVFITTGLISAILGLIPIVGPILAGILSVSVWSITRTLLYYDLRARKEGYSLEWLARDLHMNINSDLA